MKKMRRCAATVLAATMMLSSTVSAADWNTEGGEATVTGDSTVTQPVIEVALPGDLAFMIDPYRIDFEDKQIIGGDYNVVNYSNVAVEVSVSPSIVEYFEEDEDGKPTTNSLSVLKPATAAPALVEDSDGKTYKDLAPAEAGKKAVYMTAIPADATTALADTDGDGIYEFAYTADEDNVGRDKKVYTPAQEDGTPEELNYGAATAGSAVGVSEVLKLKGLGVADDDVSFTFVMSKFAVDEDVKDDDGNVIGWPKVGCVSSFTVGGAVDPKASLVDGDVQIQAVYKLATLSKNAQADTKLNENKQLLKDTTPATP